MRIAAHQAAGQVGELRQFHLQLALLRAGALGENVQNQTHAVDDTALAGFFQIALLRGRQRMVHHQQIRFQGFNQFGDFFGLAAADVQSR